MTVLEFEIIFIRIMRFVSFSQRWYVPVNKKELRYLRLKDNLTQRQMSKILRISCARYSRIERGCAVPTKNEFEKIAVFFGTGESEWQV